MSYYPELLEKQLDSYAEDGEDWRNVALSRVFPELEEQHPRMLEAPSNIQEELLTSILKSRLRFGFPEELIVIIYVGIGIGAGWATKYASKPAILLGLENIAECGWQSSCRCLPQSQAPLLPLSEHPPNSY